MALTAVGLDSSPCSVILGAQVSLDFLEDANISSSVCEVTLYSTLNHSDTTQYTYLSYNFYPKFISVVKWLKLCVSALFR